jgi:hypothetical protein
MRLHAFAFQSFQSRRGIDTVIGLRFPYNPCVIDTLKAALREAREQTSPANPGGWLPDAKAWFIERAVWPAVRRRLLAAGHDVAGDPAQEDSFRPCRT